MINVKPDTLGTLGSILETLFRTGASKPQRLIVTGPSGSGKSSWCHDLIVQAQRQRFTVAGLLSPAVVKNGHRIGIDLIDLVGGQRRRLADRRDGSVTDMMTDLWAFDTETVQWGNTLLEEMPTCDLLVIDELGPLEFKHQNGFTAAFGLLDRRVYRLACIVVRPSLLQDALDRWPDAYVVDVEKD